MAISATHRIQSSDLAGAIELSALAATIPFLRNNRFYHDIAGRHIDAVAEALLPEVVTAAQERGRARDLETTAWEILEELQVWIEKDAGGTYCQELAPE